jgi:hypothetical protein
MERNKICRCIQKEEGGGEKRNFVLQIFSSEIQR